MIADAPVMTTMPAVDLDRASAFYGDTLGLKRLEPPPGGVAFQCGDGSRLFLYERPATKADHTVLSFEVEDMESTVEALRGKGITFEEYDRPDIKTVNGIATWGEMKVAWFKDTEGNILGLSSRS